MPDPISCALLTAQQIRVVDGIAATEGLPLLQLMGRAGSAVADEVQKRWSRRTVLVLCGPGRNGGDGLVAAAELKLAGWPVQVAMTVPDVFLSGEAQAARKRWDGVVHPMTPAVVESAELVIDALFGVGLTRGFDEDVHKVLTAVQARGVPVLAVDLPSGVDANTGSVRDGTLKAEVTVALSRKKPGHLLLPARSFCGEVVVADLGLPYGVMQRVQPNLFENSPDLWSADWPVLRRDAHKYSRGQVAIMGGAHMTGAACLAAMAAGRLGAGLVRVGVPQEAWGVYAARLPAHCLVDGLMGEAAGEAFITQDKHNALVLGPGLAANQQTRRYALKALSLHKPMVLDAGALTCFSDSPSDLFGAIGAATVLTPHEGEFAKLFGYTGDALRRASLAAVQSKAVVVLKGACTVIASPDGACALNSNAPAYLATAGAGDVLSGMIGGLLAQGMPAFEAACAAVWLHGAAASAFGVGLVADDLPLLIPQILKEMDFCKTA